MSYNCPELTIVIPLFNEATCLDQNVSELITYLEKLGLSYEIVFVDDGSTDNTKEICENIVSGTSRFRLISYPVNRGKGYAVRKGILQARGRQVVFTDADLAVPVHFIGPCLDALNNGASMVIGSRHLPESSFKVRENLLREFMGEIFRRFAIFSLGLRVTDITCGFKGFNKEAAFDIFSRSTIDRWGYDAEIVFLAQKLRYAIDEVAVDWCHSFDSKVRVGIDSIRTFTEIFKVRYNYLTKRYNC